MEINRDRIARPATGFARWFGVTPEVTPELRSIGLPVNSSHHQAVERPGDGLRVVARCPADNVIEAVEGTQPGTGTADGSGYVVFDTDLAVGAPAPRLGDMNTPLPTIDLALPPS